MTQEQVGEVFRMCDRLLEDTALGLLGIVMAHHANVANARMVGSYDFEGWPSSILRLDLISGNHTQRKMKYEKIRAPRSTYLGKTVLIELGDRGYLYAATETTVQPFAGPLLIRNALRELGGEATRPELIERGMAMTNTRNRATIGYIANAIGHGYIEQLPDRGPGNHVVYRVIREEGTADV
jgi:hypothetical protein